MRETKQRKLQRLQLMEQQEIDALEQGLASIAKKWKTEADMLRKEITNINEKKCLVIKLDVKSKMFWSTTQKCFVPITEATFYTSKKSANYQLKVEIKQMMKCKTAYIAEAVIEIL